MCKSQTPVQNIPFTLSTKAQCLINSNFSFANSHITRQYKKSILVSQKKENRNILHILQEPWIFIYIPCRQWLPFSFVCGYKWKLMWGEILFVHWRFLFQFESCTIVTPSLCWNLKPIFSSPMNELENLTSILR